eukprot:XP_001689876.1 predicted protein [Chlamydomonas reinhardtii]
MQPKRPTAAQPVAQPPSLALTPSISPRTYLHARVRNRRHQLCRCAHEHCPCTWVSCRCRDLSGIHARGPV